MRLKCTKDMLLPENFAFLSGIFQSMFDEFDSKGYSLTALNIYAILINDNDETPEENKDAYPNYVIGTRKKKDNTDNW